MAHKPEEYRAQVKATVQDQAEELSDADYDLFCKRAVTQRYSKDAPQLLVSDVAGDGSHDVALPAGANQETYEDKFSVIQDIEFPIGSVPRELIDDNDWEIVRTPTGLKVRIVSSVIGAAQSVRMIWTARHTEDFKTVPDSDFYAVCDFASSLAFEALAAIYTQTGDNTIQADVTNYRTKGQEYLALAKAARKRYFSFMGIDENEAGSSGASEHGAALAIGDMDNVMGSGVDRITHSGRTR
jgi:hypothetical protein